jgi:hypothetical protein
MATAEYSFRLRRPVLGKPLYRPWVDALFICGGFSIPLLLAAQSNRSPFQLDSASKLVLLILFNYAHFASSTIRFYTKPGAVGQHRFLAFGFPLVAALVVLCAIVMPDLVGRNFTALFLTWSPYHYAAQAWGLALIYTHRSGFRLSTGEKRCLWWICMLPFLRAFINLDDTSVTDVMGVRGIGWLLPVSVTAADSPVAAVVRYLVAGLVPFIFLLPIAFAFAGRQRLPLMSLLLLLVNASWLVAFSYFDAAVWATVAHSVQYLLIVAFVHARDYPGSAGSLRGPRYQMALFYLLSILLGVLLFLAVPPVLWTLAGWAGQEWDALQCFMMVLVAVNLHHFIVDGYIWRSGRPARNSGTDPVPG